MFVKSSFLKGLTFVTAVLFFISGKVSADYRYYVWTYQFITMMPGHAELEFYTRMDHKDAAKPETASWKRQIEIESGLTERWDFSFYLVDSYKSTDARSKFDEVKIRTRYKLANKDSWIIDPLFYLEYKIQTDRSYPDRWETKLILAKDVDRFNFSINIIPEEYYKSGTKEKDWKVEYASGASYSPFVKDVVRFGIEAKGDLKEDKHLLGPTISFRGKTIWTAAGVVFGLNDKSDDYQFQTIIGLLF